LVTVPWWDQVSVWCQIPIVLPAASRIVQLKTVSYKVAELGRKTLGAWRALRR